jgi:hypothetical protein
VEVGLIDFESDDGPRRLLEQLVRRYAGVSLDGDATNSKSDVFSTSSSTSGSVTGTSSSTSAQQQKQIRKKKEALRQIALLFSLLKEYQPVDMITELLAADDDAKIDRVVVVDGGSGYYPLSYPEVTFPDPPTLGTVFGGSTAKGKVIMKTSGRVLKVDVLQGGSGYSKAPTVEISFPLNNLGNETASDKIQAKAKAYLGKGKLKGTIDRIEITDPGKGYNSMEDTFISISHPESPEGKNAVARAVLEYQVSCVEILETGRGYAAERSQVIKIDPPPGGGRPAVAMAYPRGKSTSYSSFQTVGDGGLDYQGAVSSTSSISASTSNADTANSWVIGPTSSQLLSLLPSGFGLQFDDTLQRYILTTSSSDNFDDSMFGTLEGMKFKQINPIFGIRGRSPIEREKTLDASTVLRFMASGAICSSVAHLILTPIDVVKTKVQTQPEKYNSGIVGTFQKVWKDEGPLTFFDGWEPTFVGFFFSGAAGFFLTEWFRRQYSSILMASMMAQSTLTEMNAASFLSSYEIPLVAASAATSGFCCCFLLAPFDAVRIRTVSQPDFAGSIVGVTSRMVKVRCRSNTLMDTSFFILLTCIVVLREHHRKKDCYLSSAPSMSGFSKRFLTTLSSSLFLIPQLSICMICFLLRGRISDFLLLSVSLEALLAVSLPQS